MPSDQSDTATDPLLLEFVVESSEKLAEIESQLLKLEQAEHAQDPELLNDIFRRVHTVKGLAGFLGLNQILNLAHALESVLSLMREKVIAPSSETIETLLQGSDLLRRMVLDIEASNSYDCTVHIAQLTKICEQKPEDRALQLVDCVENKLKQQNDSPGVKDSGLQPITLPTNDSVVAKVAVAYAAVSPDLASPPSSVTAKPTGPTLESGANSTIRVSVQVLEHLVNLAGELVLARNQMLRAIHSKRRNNLGAMGIKLDQVTTAMQDAIMGARMQPVDTVFARFPRIVRELNKKLNKQCRLVIEGADVELDRTILEAIVDPLTHLIRNSVDHGLETPANRVAAGKPAEGELKLCAFRRAGKVHITLSDDGKGIDRRRVTEKAVSQGLITSHQAATLSERDIDQLIFKPGFSTAEQVSDVSGRGVGMDVVKSHIAHVGGTVGIESTPGKGTTIHISLPLTLAIQSAWIVRQGSFRIALPESAIIELIRLNRGDSGVRIETVDESEVLRWRDELLPLVRLNDLLPTTHDRPKQWSQNVVVLETGWMRFGLVVERLQDPEQIVVKPLGKHFASCPYLDGAAVLGDGRVTFVLDVSGAAAYCGLSGSTHEKEKPTEITATARESQTALMFRIGDGRLAAISRMMIHRIERVDSSQLRKSGDSYTMLYSDRVLPLVTLHKDMPPPTGFGYVLVFQVMSDELGLWASELIDIREVPTKVDGRVRSMPASLGTVVVEGETVELLDVFELVDAMKPVDHGSRSQETTSNDSALTILLAEDVHFFRDQVAKFLRRVGHRVITVEDGLQAWQRLQSHSEPIDLVLTDIEMPKMDGMELCRRIKADTRLEKTPVIALTALNGETNLQRGREAGFQDWQVKLNRDGLLAAIMQHCHQSVHPSVECVGVKA